ncbi:hypothetical protein H8E88_31680 [candidate division KSB1 bacterium]|nr:hypothetical protein [candidate division KSB1 bacterium]
MNLFEIPFLPEPLTEKTLSTILFVTETFPDHEPDIKSPLTAGETVPVFSVILTLFVKLVTRLLN